MIAMLVGTLLLALSTSTHAQESPSTEEDRRALSGLEDHLDGLVFYAMEEHHLPGVVVSVVHGDSLVLAKGWGRARIQPDVPVDPERTLFRVASISKTFTFTGVMQQVEGAGCGWTRTSPPTSKGWRSRVPNGSVR